MRSKIYKIAICLVVFLIILLYIYLSFLFPLDGDGTFHARLIKEIARTGKYQNQANFLLIAPNIGFPTMYPPGFYVLNTILYLFLGDSTFEIFNVIFAAFAFLTLYLFSREYINWQTALVTTLIGVSSMALILNATKFLIMDVALSALMFFSIFSFYMSYKYKSKPYFIAFGCSLLASISLKQQAYILIPVFLLFLVVNIRRIDKKSLINYLFVFLVVFAVLIPTLVNLFENTGTFLYPGVTFPIITSLENKIAINFGIVSQPIENEDFIYYARGSRERLFSRYLDYKELIDFYCPVNSLYSASKLNIYSITFFILFIFGIIYNLKKREYLLILTLIFSTIFLIKIGNPRYFIFAQLVGYIVIGTGIYYLKEIKVLSGLARKIALLFVVLIIILALVNSLSTSTNLVIKQPDSEIGPIPAEDRLYDLIAASEWLKENTQEDSIIAGSRTHQVAYYSDRTTTWITAVGGTEIYEAFLTNKTGESIKTFKEYGVDYIYVVNKLILNKVGIWPSYYPPNGLVSVVGKDKHFTKVYENKNIRIYKINYDN